MYEVIAQDENNNTHYYTKKRTKHRNIEHRTKHRNLVNKQET